MKKSAAQLDQEIMDALTHFDARPDVLLRRAEFVQRALVGDGGVVEISDPNSTGARRITISHPASGHYETFGVSKYGIPPNEVRFGDAYKGARKFSARMRTVINKAKRIA